MTSGQQALLIAFVIFAGGSYLGVKGLEYVLKLKDAEGAALAPFDDRLIGGLAVLSGLVGAYNVARLVPISSLVLLGVVCIVLDYACCADLRAGRVPAVVAVPIAIVAAGMDVVRPQPDVISLAAGIMIALPFAVATITTRGRSGGFGDSGIAALGGFVLGAQLGILAVAVACFAAAGTGFAMKKQGASIPFAPFLAIALQIALFVPEVRSLAQ